ncbi:MAG: acyltransferase [archaeon]|nr:acyltransferase [archaeon]
MTRLKNVDMVKGVAIFAIVILHAMYCQPSYSTTSIASSPPIDFLYSGLIAFFIFSGYFYRPERNAKQNITKRILQLTVVSTVLLLVLPLILMVEYMAVGIGVSVSDYVDCLFLLVGGDNVFSDIGSSMSQRAICGVFPGYYYVQVMIVSFVMFYLIAPKVADSIRNMAVVIAAMVVAEMVLIGVVGLKLPFYAQLAPIATAFMFVGLAAKRYGVFEYLQDGWKTPRYWYIFIADLVVCAMLLMFIPPGHSFDSNYFGEYGAWSVVPFFFTMVSCVYILVVLGSLVSKVPLVSGLFCRIGTHSLALLLFHAFVIKLITVPVYGITAESWFPKMPMEVSIAVALVTVAVVTVAAELYPRFISKLSKA